ncbi:MAG: flippase-like domain-containing protein, partial [Clostridia bacterium]|nr:flippase-like domain-containing protein [Clostridia bacterium]
GVCVKCGGITGAILNSAAIPEVQAKLVATMAWIGFVVVTALMLAVAVVVMNKRVGTAIVVFFVRLFCKLFRRNYDKLFRKTMRTVTTWQTTMRRYKKSPWIWIANIFLSVVFYFVLYSIPYFIYCAFMGWNAAVWIEVIVLAIIIDMTASFIPLPGGTGLMEISFIFLFGIVVKENIVWALLLYRFISYYLIIIHGFGHELIKIGKNIYKNRKIKETA